MTILLTGYATKKDLKASIGEPLQYQETSMFGAEYVADGFVTGARRPHMLGGGREFFARVELENGLIKAVE
jgi:hypothetical protein